MEKTIIILNTDSIIFTSWIKSKINQKYLPLFFFIDQNLNLSKNEMINKINDIIKINKISMGFFQGDYISLIDYNFIKKINLEKKILYLTDDFDMHEVNSISSLACDSILTCCPISVLKYKEKQLNAFYIFHESDEKVFQNRNLTKEIDVLFYGILKADRSYYLDKLSENNINLKIVGSNNKFVSYENLVELINKSKIVLNFSQTGNKNKFYSHSTYPFNYLQVKGRLAPIGMCGSLCVSEYAPGHELIFEKNLIPTFHNSDQMIQIIKELLSNEELLINKTEAFVKECNKYNDSNYMKKIFTEISNVSHRKDVKKIPCWYIRAFNIKSLKLYGKNKFLLSFTKNLLLSIFNFTPSSFATKLLNLIETIVYTPYIYSKIIYNKLKIEKNKKH